MTRRRAAAQTVVSTAKAARTTVKQTGARNLQVLIKLALEEDIGSGDITTQATIDPKRQGTAIIHAKTPLVVAGLCVAETVFSTVDKKLAWSTNTKDGDRVQAGTALAHIRGPLASILTAERTALNFLQRLSGIATLTRTFVDAVAGTNVKILDTRKTTPGWRALEKGAVRAGNGTSHRMGLYDRYLIKNNHITAVGSLEKAMRSCLLDCRARGLRRADNSHRSGPHAPLIEVEVRTLKEAIIAAKAGVDIIMLDNMTVAQVREAVKIVGAVREPPL
ncbi:MAG: carboxylating nicotinate-nucleotide diphosphorylase, partial [Deltaproteobacteria bacterium]|nr:carboxylating nicotinate-nucleotide diphosphorylase [Deltaproteobacteria bacterium]